MRITEVLRRKGDTVITIDPGSTVRDLLALLAEHRIGAVVVSAGDDHLDGIVSERDVVRRLQADGDGVLDRPVATIMTTQVHTCTPQDEIDSLMALMTQNRVRHVPVLVDDRLVGLVSIGDVVNHRLAEVQAERDQLTAYISG